MGAPGWRGKETAPVVGIGVVLRLGAKGVGQAGARTGVTHGLIGGCLQVWLALLESGLAHRRGPLAAGLQACVMVVAGVCSAVVFGRVDNVE